MNKIELGDKYEKFVFENIKNKYNKCYLWKDIPLNILPSKFYKNNKICIDIG